MLALARPPVAVAALEIASMPTSIFGNSSFDSVEAAILTNAYTQAVIAIGGVCTIDASVQVKLAKIVLAIGRNRIKAGGEIATAADAESIATLASTRFLYLFAAHPPASGMRDEPIRRA